MAEVRKRLIDVNGVTLCVFEAGDPADPTIVLSHGFPESAYSWRHQLRVLADAGYHVLAPDQRGYGGSSVPREVSAYGIAELAGDLIGLLDQAGKDDAVFVGHDWGALIVWDLARLHTQRVRAVVAASVPAVDWPAPPTQLMKMVHQDNFFYILYFQPVGPAENELEANPRATLEKVLWSASGDGSGPSKRVPMEGNGFLTHLPTPPALPWGWLSDTDLRHYADEFARTGFFGPLSYYRNFDTNYELVKNIHLDQLTMPTFFITGSKDLVIQMDPAGVDRMANSLPNFYGTAVLDGVGHWTQQERPTEFNEVLLGFLQRLDHTA